MSLYNNSLKGNMIIIDEPKLDKKGKELKISVDFEIDGEKKNLWYSFPCQFEEYIVVEQLDAFVIGLLFLGLKTGYDIKLKAPLSARLYYTLSHYLIEAICLANPSFKKIKIKPDSLTTKDLNTAGMAGTGLSCGVDSFATYFDHKKDEKPFKIEFLTFFNVGSHGDNGGEHSRRLFKTRMARVEKFAKYENVNFIPIDSNLSEVLNLNFQNTHTLRSVSCVLLMQKLVKNYYYASSLRFDRFKLNDKRIAEYDLLILQMLSTESTNLFSSVSQMNRIDRIEFISKHSSTYKFLDVCTHDSSKKDGKINCSSCQKCIRTMLTLDLLGYLRHYEGVFNLDHYLQNRTRYIGEVLFNDRKETLDFELVAFIKEKNIKIPLKSYFYGLRILYVRRKYSLKKLLNSIKY